MFACATCRQQVPAAEAVAHSKACAEAECIDLTVRVAARVLLMEPLFSVGLLWPSLALVCAANTADLKLYWQVSPPPAKSARGAHGGSPQAARHPEPLLAPGSCAARPLVLSDSPPRRAPLTHVASPRRALASVQQAAAAAFQKAAYHDGVQPWQSLPRREFLSPPLCADDDDEEELPRAPWSRAPAPRPAAAAPASARKVAATLWPDDDGDASVKADSDAEDEYTDESAAAAEAALKNFGHLDDAPLDAALLVDVRTRLKLHQLIFCRWARDRTAVILADDMGLGKTLESLALCRARMPPPDWSGGGTLVVVPKSLLAQWKKEYSKHLGGVHGGLHLFYGAKKTTDPARLKRFEFVLTTYEQVRNCAAAKPRAAIADDDELFSLDESPLAQLHWWRIILDEAHVARNRNTRLCAALCGLRAGRRVALSGTPIQNGLADIYSLLRWLKVPGPLRLDEPDTRSGEVLASRQWKTRVSTPLTGKKNPQARSVAFGLLNSVLSDVLIRRVKKDTIRGQPLITLPSLTYDDQTVAFTADEQALYETLWSDAVACFNRHLKKGDVLKNCACPRNAYRSLLACVNAARYPFCIPPDVFILVKLLRLRQCAAHPALVVEQRDVCGACTKPLGNGGSSGKLSIAPCGHKFCSECIEACVDGKRPPALAAGGRGRGRGRGRSAGRSAGGRSGSGRKLAGLDSDDSDDEPAAAGGAPSRKGCKCPLRDCDEWLTRDDLAPFEADGGEESAISRPLGAAAGGHEQSTKIAMLLKGLKALPKGAKSLVFSQWTSLLNIVHPFLSAAGIDAERLDGSMSMEERSAAVDRFTDDDGCSVFMLSLKAGGVGLHLVAATHVWLLDPWWNPMVEEQAFQRCHRLGQQHVRSPDACVVSCLSY